MFLDFLEASLAERYSQLADSRESGQLFAVEHNLSETEVLILKSEIANSALRNQILVKHHKLCWVVFATEIAKDFEGQEYWPLIGREVGKTFDDNGNRQSLVGYFKDFAKDFGGRTPSGSYATHFTHISWPLTHAIITRDFAKDFKQLANRVLARIRVEREDVNQLGTIRRMFQTLANLDRSLSPRFLQFLEDAQNNNIIKTIYFAATSNSFVGTDFAQSELVSVLRTQLDRAGSKISTGPLAKVDRRPTLSLVWNTNTSKWVLVATFAPLTLPEVENFPNSFEVINSSMAKVFRTRDLRDGLGNVQLGIWPDTASVIKMNGDVDPRISGEVHEFTSKKVSFEKYTERWNEVFKVQGGTLVEGEESRRYARRVVTKNLGLDSEYLLVVSNDFGSPPGLPEIPAGFSGAKVYELNPSQINEETWESLKTRFGLKIKPDLRITSIGITPIAQFGDTDFVWAMSQLRYLKIETPHLSTISKFGVEHSVLGIQPGECILDLNSLGVGIHEFQIALKTAGGIEPVSFRVQVIETPPARGNQQKHSIVTVMRKETIELADLLRMADAFESISESEGSVAIELLNGSDGQLIQVIGSLQSNFDAGMWRRLWLEFAGGLSPSDSDQILKLTDPVFRFRFDDGEAQSVKCRNTLSKIAWNREADGEVSFVSGLDLGEFNVWGVSGKEPWGQRKSLVVLSGEPGRWKIDAADCELFILRSPQISTTFGAIVDATKKSIEPDIASIDVSAQTALEIERIRRWTRERRSELVMEIAENFGLWRQYENPMCMISPSARGIQEIRLSRISLRIAHVLTLDDRWAELAEAYSANGLVKSRDFLRNRLFSRVNEPWKKNIVEGFDDAFESGNRDTLSVSTTNEARFLNFLESCEARTHVDGWSPTLASVAFNIVWSPDQLIDSVDLSFFEVLEQLEMLMEKENGYLLKVAHLMLLDKNNGISEILTERIHRSA